MHLGLLQVQMQAAAAVAVAAAAAVAAAGSLLSMMRTCTTPLGHGWCMAWIRLRQ